MELGLTSFAETHSDPTTGEPISHGERLRNVVEEVALAEQVGLDVYGQMSLKLITFFPLRSMSPKLITFFHYGR